MEIDRLPDIQKSLDQRGIELEQVGISHLKYPIRFFDTPDEQQTTIAEISMSVGLPHHIKGTHMSRFVEVLEQQKNKIGVHHLSELLNKLKDVLDAETSTVAFEFPFFLQKPAPVSGNVALMDYQCKLEGISTPDGWMYGITLTVPVASLCPCSKEISDYGAHNQRGEVLIGVKPLASSNGSPQAISVKSLINAAEQAASSPLYPLLKRTDERHVTMQAYDKPAFVEDITRDVALNLKAFPEIGQCSVQVTNFESIHNHNAFAVANWSRKSL
jgi:GTP cyclohydrolase I